MNISQRTGMIFVLFIVLVLFVITRSSTPPLHTQTNISPTSRPILTPHPSIKVTTAAPSTAAISQSPTLYTVVNVVDGDTIDIQISGIKQRVRLLGINTPETVDPRRPVQCFGHEASDKMKSLLTNKQVTIESDPTQGNTDKYGRLLRYIYIPDGTLVNELMIAQGYAYEYTYNIRYKYQKEFKAAQKKAETEQVGLWAPGVCTTTSPTPLVTTATQQSSPYTCNCSKSCASMASCEEAQFQLTVCGCLQRDGDNDGVACNGDPLRCHK